MSASDDGPSTPAAVAAASGGNCATCGCCEFTSQFYRPALCNTCFHDIAAHFSGDWKKVVEGGKVYYVANADPSQKLFARAADASDAVRGRVAVVKAKPKADSAAAAAAGKVGAKISAWETFAPGQVVPAPPHLAEAAAAAQAEEDAATGVAPAGVETHEEGSAPASGAGAAPTARPLMRLPSVPVMADGTVLPSPAGIHVPGVTDVTGGVASLPTPAGPLLPTITESLRVDEDEDDNYGATQVVTEEGADDQQQPVLAIPEDVPEAPSAVPQAAFANLNLNLSELQNQLASPVPSRASAVDVLAAAEAEEASAAAAAGVAPSPGGPGLAAAAAAVPSSNTTAEKEQWSPVSPGGSTFAASPAAKPKEEAVAPAPAPAAAAPAPAPAPAAASSGPAVDLSLHLAPIYDSPLMVDVDALLKKGAASGVSLFAVKQPFEEDYAVPRHLLITPFTIMALAPHPTKLGVGILKWERSILSLRRLTAQPLFSKDPVGKAAAAAAAAQAHAAAAAGGGAGAADHSSNSSKGGVFGFLKKAADGAASAISRVVTGDAAGANAVTDADRLVPVPPPVLLDDPEALAKALARPDAVGLLASFAPETTDTVALLRMYRAGARPVKKEGFLHKRKRQAWREKAPLGPLGWKKRYFVLQPTHITYYGASPEQGGTAKGVIPLTGWVEVAKVGAESEAVHKSLAHDSTTRPHCFIVRTGRTHHVFQANSAEDCDAWITAISTNAQHVGMSLDDPHCLVLQDSKEMAKLAEAIVARRKDLLASMSSDARKAAEKAFEVDLSMGEDDGVDGDVGARRAALARRAAEAGFRMRGDSTFGDGDDDDDDEEGGSSRHGEPDPGTGPSLADAIAMVEATGGITEEILNQCSPAVRAKLLQYFGHTKDQQMRRAQHPSFRQPQAQPSRAAAATGAGSAAAAAAAGKPREGAWLYLDDFDKIQGPFTDSMMRTWLWAGMLRPDICCRYAYPMPGVLDASEGVDNNFVPQVLIPLSVLFTDPHRAFVTGDFSWVPVYRDIAKFQYLFQTAVAMGVDRSVALKQTYVMKENGMPADLSLLLDMCGVRDVTKLKKPSAAAAAALKPHPPPPDAKHGGRRNSGVTEASVPASSSSSSSTAAAAPAPAPAH